MLKNKKIITFITFIILLLISNTCLATTASSDKLKLEIVENNVCTIQIKDTAIFEKKIVNYDLDKKELTLEMKITNIAEKPLSKPTEILLVLDTSDSMKNEISDGVTRFDAIKSAANKLTTELLKNDTVKIGIVSYSVSENAEEFGTLADAKLESALSNSASTITSTIDDISIGNGQTDIDAGLTLASKNFSDTCENKFIILLTDGIPNVSLGNPKFEFSGVTATNTKNTLDKLTNEEDINIISVMTGVDPNVENPETGMTYKELAEEIFGTPEAPNYGKFYYIPDTKIEKTISEDILKDITNEDTGILTNVDIYDYFPQEIVDNFNFEYVTSPNLGKISPSIDLQNNFIVWHIDSLAYGEVGTVSYKLTVKDNVNTDIINVVLNTNEKVEINADELDTPISSTVSPKVKLTGDTTTSDKVIPQTGSTYIPFIITTVVIVACVVIGIRFYLLNRDVK